MLYLVTGGAGFIGTNLVQRLLLDGHSVRVLDNFSAGDFSRFPQRRQADVEYIIGDIRNQEDVEKAVKGVDGIFHEAAIPRVTYSVEHPEETHDVNVNGTVRLLLAAKDGGVKRVVFATSSSVYGNDKPIALAEDMPKHPQSPYALHKLIGQEYCRLFSDLYGLETVALCYFNIYGPHLDPDGAYALVIGKFLKQKKEGTPLTICGDGEYYRDYTHVTDCVDANVRAMTSPAAGHGEMINIGNSRPVSVNELATLIGGPTATIPPRLGDARYSKADITRAKNLLGWEPTISLEQGIEEMKREWKIV